ncbi:MAG: hypothetical protein O7E52_26450 [Candidatus Poribacteria bacterium]|nr:hypothetical protein [Candidatus Poribacteria bacterium]
MIRKIIFVAFVAFHLSGPCLQAEGGFASRPSERLPWTDSVAGWHAQSQAQSTPEILAKKLKEWGSHVKQWAEANPGVIGLTCAIVSKPRKRCGLWR